MENALVTESDTGTVTDESSHQYLTFMLAGEEYGVDILRVQEIKGWEEATHIPNTPEYVKGVINIRGTIVPIIDLRARFNLDTIAYGATTVVIVLKVESDNSERTMGVIADGVSDVYNISEKDLKESPEMGTSGINYVNGLATVGEKMIITLDIDALLDNSHIPDPSSLMNKGSTPDNSGHDNTDK